MPYIWGCIQYDCILMIVYLLSPFYSVISWGSISIYSSLATLVMVMNTWTINRCFNRMILKCYRLYVCVMSLAFYFVLCHLPATILKQISGLLNKTYLYLVLTIITYTRKKIFLFPYTNELSNDNVCEPNVRASKLLRKVWLWREYFNTVICAHNNGSLKQLTFIDWKWFYKSTPHNQNWKYF